MWEKKKLCSNKELLIKNTTFDVAVTDCVEFWLIPDDIFLSIRRSCFAGICFDQLKSCDLSLKINFGQSTWALLLEFQPHFI